MSPQQLMASYASANSSMASPASLNTAALFAQHQRYYAQQHYPQTAATSPRHFNFAASNDYELRSDVDSGSFHVPADSAPPPPSNRYSPRSSVQSHRSDADANTVDPSLINQSSYESSQGVMCQDERDGLASLLSCSLISPRAGDERNDVLSEDEEDLFLFSDDDEKDASEDPVQGGVMEEERSSPTIEELANSMSCFSREVHEEEPLDPAGEQETRVEKSVESMVSPVSLADRDDDEGTVRDVVDDSVEYVNNEQHPRASFVKIEQTSSTYSKIKKMVTIQSFPEQEAHSTIEANPTFQSRQSSIGSSKKKSLLEQAKQRPVHSDIKPYKPEVHIPDDESEASLVVLMRYMGCTPQAFGERKQISSAEGGLDMPSGREFLFDSDDEDDDVTTLSGGTYESSIRDLNTCTWTVDGEGEEGIELLINDYLPPSMKLKRSVSLDEGTMMSGMCENESITKTASNVDENDSLSDPVIAAIKAVNNSIISGALTPRAAEVVDRTTVPKHVSRKMRSKPVLTVKTRINDDSPCAAKPSVVNEEEQVTKTASNVSRVVQRPVQPRDSVISTTTTATSDTRTKLLSPASEARAYLASRNERATSTNTQFENVVVPASPASRGTLRSEEEHAEQKVDQAMSKASKAEDSFTSRKQVESDVTQASISLPTGDNVIPVSPATEADLFLAVPEDVRNVSSVISVVSQAPRVSMEREDGKSASVTSKAKAHLSPAMGTENERSSRPGAAKSVSSKQIGDKRTAEVDDLIAACLREPKDSKLDKETLISSISAASLCSPSLQKITQSNLLSGPTPRAKNVAADSAASTHKKVDPPSTAVSSQKKLEPSGASPGKEVTTSGMTPLEMKLAKKAVLKPLRTDGSFTNMQIDGKNSALSPISNISESTMGTLDTMALISMAQRVSSDVKERTDASKKSSSYDLLKKYGSSNRIWKTSENNGSNARPTIGTLTEVPSVTTGEEESRASDKKEQVSKNMEPKKSTLKKNTSEDLLNKYLPDNTTANLDKLTHNGKVKRTDSGASGPLVLSPEESSSFDKSDVMKGTKTHSMISNAYHRKTSDETTKGLNISISSREENVREPPPPLTPCRESVREVDELLSKTRSWLVRHNEDRKARKDLESIKESSLLESRLASAQFKERTRLEFYIGKPVSPPGRTSASSANLSSPNSDVSSVSRKSILEELADLKAKQLENSRNSAKVRLE